MERPDFFELNNGEKVKLPFQIKSTKIEYQNLEMLCRIITWIWQF